MTIGLLLTIIFVVLKLTGSITWPWLGVLAPFLIELAIDVILFLLFLVGVIFAAAEMDD